jgi:tetrahydromethanopterin S-methyltransferase subunit A
MLAEAVPYLENMVQSSVGKIEKQIAAAQAKKIGDEDAVRAFLNNRFSRTQSGAIMAAHIADEGRPIESIWDATTAVTAYARDIPFVDSRVELEREGGRILDMVA